MIEQAGAKRRRVERDAEPCRRCGEPAQMAIEQRIRLRPAKDGLVRRAGRVVQAAIGSGGRDDAAAFAGMPAAGRTLPVVTPRDASRIPA
jgi:hypothetical protein